ncbi:MAG: beta-propeller domain-containing protein [Clostridia bacterium]|nr:beta-propeller domain-containing protein [Clostridia bacterium]
MKNYNERTQDILQKAAVQKKRNAKTVKTATLLSVLLTVILAFNLFMFVPYSTGGFDIRLYKDSKYYSVIQKVGELTYDKAVVKSNFERWTEKLGDLPVNDGDASGATPPTVTAPGTAEGNDGYKEVTNNQTDGVIEGDLFKRGGDKVYYLSVGGAYYGDDGRIGEITDFIDFKNQNVHFGLEFKLQVYPLKGADTVKTQEFLIGEKDGMVFSYSAVREMFLSSDCTTITVLSPCYDKENHLYTAVISIDVSDTSDIKEINRTYISGQYVSSRVKDGDILLVSNFTVRWKPDFSDETQYLPHTGKPDSFTPLAANDIICPDDASSANYTVICMLDEKTLDVCDSAAFMSFSNEVYVSESNLFVTRTHTVSHAVSSIYCVAYGEDGLDFAGNCEIDGRIINRYCMDEYEGVLRVTTDVAYSEDIGVNSPAWRTYKGASLYCIDLNSFEIIASVERFAPNGESVKSARFDKNTAYVCTAVNVNNIVKDPVFVFNLSDYNNIPKPKDTGTIPGYSLSLTKFKDDTLLGIGYGENLGTLKVELYRESNSDVKSVAMYELENTEFSEEYKAYYINADKGLIGLGAYYHGGTRYIVLRYDGYSLREVATIDFESRDWDDMRACMEEEFLYVFDRGGVKVVAPLLLV